MGNGFVKWRRVREGVLGECGDDEPLFINFRGIYVGVDIGQGCVILWPEEGKRRNQRPGAHPRNELKLRTIAVSCPAGQQSSAEGPIIATPRERQKIRGRQDTPAADAESPRFPNESAFLFGRDRPRLIDEKACVGKTENGHFVLVARRNR